MEHDKYNLFGWPMNKVGRGSSTEGGSRRTRIAIEVTGDDGASDGSQGG